MEISPFAHSEEGDRVAVLVGRRLIRSTTIRRFTPHQVITADGDRFMRRDGRRLGSVRCAAPPRATPWTVEHDVEAQRLAAESALRDGARQLAAAMRGDLAADRAISGAALAHAIQAWLAAPPVGAEVFDANGVFPVDRPRP